MRAFLTTAILLVSATVGAQQAAMTVADFSVADKAAKTRVLYEVAFGPATVGIGDAVALLRAGLHDSSAEVRTAALAAAAARTQVARWAGRIGPGLGPDRAPLARLIPVEWKDDQATLRDALERDCEALLRHDPDDGVRYQALLAIGNLERPLQADDPLSQYTVDLFIDLYRHDSSARIRAEVVKTFRLVPNSAAEMRAVLRDALVDPVAEVRFEGMTAITPEATLDPRRLSFDEARATVVAALSHRDAAIRLAAVQALNIFGAPSAPYVDDLERLHQTDPDDQVRESARLAIEAIDRAVRALRRP